MWEDPIVKETRAAREELFAQFHYDLPALCAHLRQKQSEHGVGAVTRDPRPPEPVEILGK